MKLERISSVSHPPSEEERVEDGVGVFLKEVEKEVAIAAVARRGPYRLVNLGTLLCRIDDFVGENFAHLLSDLVGMGTDVVRALLKVSDSLKKIDKDTIIEEAANAGHFDIIAGKYDIDQIPLSVVEDVVHAGQARHFLEKIYRKWERMPSFSNSLLEVLMQDQGAAVCLVLALERIYQEPWVGHIIDTIPLYISTAETFLYEYAKDPLWGNEVWVGGVLEQSKLLVERAQQEVVKRRDKILEDGGAFTLSKVDFQKYFPLSEEVGTEIFQGNVNDCYLVSSIDAMRRWPHFEMVCRSSVERQADGSWRVKIPFMNQDGKVVVVTQEDIKADTEGRHPLSGSEGYQVLEAAYIKALRGVLDRSNLGAVGDLYEAIKLFSPDIFIADNLSDRVQLQHFLTTFNRDFYFAIMSMKRSINVDSVSLKTGKKSGRVQLPASHVYSIFDVDRNKELLYFIDPHNTTRLLQMGFDDLEKRGVVDMIRVNNENLLHNMKNLKKIP